MARLLEVARWNLVGVAFVLFVAAVDHAQAQSCPEPSRLHAPAIAYNSITFRWDATKYIPNPLHCTCMSLGNYGEKCSSGSTPKVCATSVSGYVRPQTSLATYTNYTLCVQTQCSGSNFSNPVCTTVRTSPTAPSQPFQIFATKHTPYSLDISWRYPTVLNGPLDGYRIRWCWASNCVSSYETLHGPNVRQFRITGLTAYRQYNVYVSGFNVDPFTGQTLYGAEASISEYTLPTYPTESSLSFTKVSTSQVNVVVGVPKYPNGPISGYVLTWCPKRRCYGDNVNTREILQSNAGTQSITGLQPWTEYEVSVKAFNTVPTNSERAYSDEVKGTVVPMPFSPSGPQNFKATALSSTSVKLTWDLPPRFEVTPSHYRIFWCTAGDKVCFNLDVGNVREAVITPLAPYTDYRFMIKALAQFTSPWLNSAVSNANAKTWPHDPSRPVDLVVVSRQATKVDVSWKTPLDPAGPLDGYRVRICPELGTCPAIGVISRSKTLHKSTHNNTFYGLQPYTKYQVQVKAFNNLPDGKTSEGDVAVIAVSTTASEPSEPTNLTVETVNSTTLLVTWQPPSHKNGPVHGYNVSWWKTGGSSVHDVDEVSSSESVFLAGEAKSYILQGLQSYTTYAVRVVRVNNYGNGTLEGAAAHAEGITDPDPCPPPVDVSVQAVKINATASKLVCSWSPPNATLNPPVEGYLLQVCTDHNASTCWEANTTVPTLSHTFEPVPNFEDYVFVVQAYVLNHGRVVVGQSASARVSSEAPVIPLVPDFNATAANSTAIYVDWKPVGSVQDFEVTYNVTAVDSYGVQVRQEFVSEPRVTFADLEAYTVYHVYVSVCVERGSKRQCGAARLGVVRTAATASSEPTSLVVASNDSAIHITWEEPLHGNGPLLGYNVSWWQIYPAGNSSEQAIQSNITSVFLQGNVYSYVVTGLNPQTFYSIEVRRINGQGSERIQGIAALVKAKTTPNSYPKPEDARFTIRRVDATLFSIHISWKPPPLYDEDAHYDVFEVFVQRIEEGKQPIVFTVNPVDAEYFFNVRNLNPFVEYVVQIRAYISFGGFLVKSEAAELRIAVDAKTLLVVSQIETTNSPDGALVIRWKSSASVESSTTVYEVKVVAAGTGKEVDSTVVSSHEATFTGLQQNTNYTVRIRACDLRGHIRKCGESTEASFQTSKADNIPRARDVSVVAVNSTALKVSWQIPTSTSQVSVTGYRVGWRLSESNLSGTTAQSGLVETQLSGGNETTFIVTGLEAYKQYDIEIVIFYVVGNVAKNTSVISKGTTAPKPLEHPSNVAFEISSDIDNLTRVKFKWDPPKQITGPQLEGYYINICPVEERPTLPGGATYLTYNTSSTTFTTVLEGMNRLEAYNVFVSAYTRHQGLIIVGNSAQTFVSADLTPFLRVHDVKIEVVSKESVKVSWSSVDLSSTRWTALYEVTVVLKSSGKEVFVGTVNSTEVTLTGLSGGDEHTIRVEACIIRGGEKQCGRKSRADVKPLIYVHDKQGSKTETVNSTAIAVTFNQVTSAEPSLVGFEVSWSPKKPSTGQGQPGSTGSVILPRNETGFVITDLLPSEHYDVQVTKVFSDGNAEWKTVISNTEVVTDPKPYPKPTGVVHKSTSSGGTSSTLTVGWNAPVSSSGPPIEGYQVTICPREKLSAKATACQTFNTSATETHVDVTTLESFSEYEVKITAYTTNNGRIVKGDVTRTTVTTSAPPIPSVVSQVVSNSIEGRSATASWTRPQGIPAKFDVVYEVVLTEEASGRVLSRRDVNVTGISVEDLQASTEYTLSITPCLVSGSRRECGNSSYTTFKSSSKGGPKEPIHLHIKAVNSTALLITWPSPPTNTTPFDGYLVIWWTANETAIDEESVSNKTLAADSTSFLIGDLKPSTTYYVNVSRIYGDNERDAIDLEQVAGSTQPDPFQKPSGLHVDYDANASQATVTWDPFPVRLEDSPVQNYSVMLCDVAGNGPDENLVDCNVVIKSADNTKAVFTNLKGLTEYRVEVWAVVTFDGNSTGQGDSAVSRFTTPAPVVPELWDSLRADLKESDVSLFWSRPAGLDEYELRYHVILYRESPQSTVRLVTNVTQAAFEGLKPQTNYTVYVATCILRRSRQHCTGNTTIEFKTLRAGPREDFVNYTVEAVNGSELRLSWAPPGEHEDLKSYQVSWWLYQANQTGEVVKRNASVSSHSTMALIDGLQPYTKYVVEVVPIYGSLRVTWQGSAVRHFATTKAQGFPAIANVSVTTTNRKPSTSDMVVAWSITNSVISMDDLEYRVTLCVGTHENAQDCLNKTVSGHIFSVTFPGIDNFAALVATVQLLVRTENEVFESAIIQTTSTSWTPPIPEIVGLTVAGVTENSADVFWSKVAEFDRIHGSYYRVVLSAHPQQDVNRNAATSQSGQSSSESETAVESERNVVRNFTTRDTEIELSKLSPWRNYTVTVTAGVVGRGLDVEGLASSKGFETLVGAPTKPRNVSVAELNNGHILTWLPPESWNGPGAGYEVKFTCVNGDIKGNSTVVTLDPSRTALRMPQLSPGVPCNIFIHAYNVHLDEPLDGAKVRVRFTPTASKGEEHTTIDHPTIN
ncbi:fibronectin-like isoform X2 [Amblyomma americanum]